MKSISDSESSPVQTSKFSLTIFICSCVHEKIAHFLDKEPGLKASRTGFQQGNLLVCTCNKEHLTRELFVYVLNSCGLVKVVKKEYFTYARTNKGSQGKLVEENLFVVQTRK